MLGASRRSLEQLRASLPAGDLAVAGELYAVRTLLAGQRGLRQALADSGSSGPTRAGIAQEVFGARISSGAAQIVSDVAATQWSNESDLLAGLAALAAEVALGAAAAGGALPTVEEELFRFQRAVDVTPELALTLTDPALDAARRVDLIDALLTRADPTTRLLLTESLRDLRGIAPATIVAELVAAAAQQRDQVVANVRTALTLSDDQRLRLVTALTRSVGRAVRLNAVVDPTVVGGLVVTIGDEVIDGSTATKLDQARRAVLA